MCWRPVSSCVSFARCPVTVHSSGVFSDGPALSTLSQIEARCHSQVGERLMWALDDRR